MAWDRPRRCLRSRRSSTDDDDDTTMMIPEDLWADILKRLPVKKLLQVRSVCKSWKALISSPSFIKIHQCTVSSRLEVTETKSGDSLSSCRIGRKDPNNGFGCTITFKPLAFPQTPRYKLVNPSYLGVGHGVFMLCYLEPVVAFWNPAIRKHYLIPWPESENTPCRLDGFGLDPKTNDFKVVRSRMEGSYDVFSVREGAWRMNCQSAVLGSSSSPHLEACYLTGPYLDGAIYWITAPAIEGVYDWRSQGPFGLLRFDCASDEFTATDLPLELVSNPIAPHLLFPLGSGLVLIERLPAPGLKLLLLGLIMLCSAISC